MKRKRKLFVPRSNSNAGYKYERKYPGPLKGRSYRTNNRLKLAPSGFNSDAKLRNHIDNLKKNAIATQAKPTFQSVSKFIADTKQKKNYRIKTQVGVKFHVGKITPPAGLGQEEEGKHIHITHDVNVTSVLIGSDPVSVFKRKIETGVPSAKPIVDAAKQNGTTTEILFDTKTAQSTDKEFFSRKQLTFGTGFNQKGLTVFGDNAYVTYQDIRDMTMGTGDIGAFAANKLQRITASVLHSRTEMILRNQSAHLRAKVKVHLVTHKPGINALFSPIDDLSTQVFYTSLTDITEISRRTKVPPSYQFTPVTLETAGTAEGSAPNAMMHVDYDPSTNILNYSPYFKDHFEIVGSVGQMLGPGDFLNFSHIHHYGWGFDISKIFASAPTSNLNDNLRNKPVSYFYIIEYQGLPCEVTKNNAGDYEHHLGSSPVILSSELRKKVVYANPGRDNTEAITTLGVLDKVHMRVTTEDSDPEIGGTNKKFNLNLVDWVAATPTDGKYILQVSSDRTLRSDTNQAGNTNATDIIP